MYKIVYPLPFLLYFPCKPKLYFCIPMKLLSNLLMLKDLTSAEMTSTWTWKCVLNPSHSHMCLPNPYLRPNSRHPKAFLEHRCNTTRLFKSLIPSMARLLNKNSYVSKNSWLGKFVTNGRWIPFYILPLKYTIYIIVFVLIDIVSILHW